MNRFARIVSCVSIAFLAFAGRSQAQTPAKTTTPASDASRYYAAGQVGATFGHKSSGSVGFEVGGKLNEPVTIFFEGGRMMNVGTSDLDARAAIIANAVGATMSTAYKVNYFDAGIRYTHEMFWPVRPYLLFGIGVAQVRAETALAVGGNTVAPETLGVQFGSDLNGTEKKTLLMFGGGATYEFAKRYFADFSYRYGRILPKTSVIENDKGINTSRAQLGVGVRF